MITKNKVKLLNYVLKMLSCDDVKNLYFQKRSCLLMYYYERDDI